MAVKTLNQIPEAVAIDDNSYLISTDDSQNDAKIRIGNFVSHMRLQQNGSAVAVHPDTVLEPSGGSSMDGSVLDLSKIDFISVNTANMRWQYAGQTFDPIFVTMSFLRDCTLDIGKRSAVRAEGEAFGFNFGALLDPNETDIYNQFWFAAGECASFCITEKEFRLIGFNAPAPFIGYNLQSIHNPFGYKLLHGKTYIVPAGQYQRFLRAALWADDNRYYHKLSYYLDSALPISQDGGDFFELRMCDYNKRFARFGYLDATIGPEGAPNHIHDFLTLGADPWTRSLENASFASCKAYQPAVEAEDGEAAVCCLASKVSNKQINDAIEPDTKASWLIHRHWGFTDYIDHPVYQVKGQQLTPLWLGVCFAVYM